MAKPQRPSLSDLGALRDQLKAQAIERERAAEQARQDAARAALEANLFRASVGEVQPLTTPPKAKSAPPKPAPTPVQREADERQVLVEAISDEFDPESLLDTDDELSWQRPPLGADVVRKLRRGHWVLQDELDLHGARSDEARELVGDFLRDALRRGLRCVRVIHGKGLGSKDRQPVLKGKVRKWLMQRDEVIAFCSARAADGGSGAVVVLLRATR
jgi:DNA-nicking Smr family endonuclease